MTTNPIHLSSEDHEWRSPSNLKPSVQNGEPARVRWPRDASKPLTDHEAPWKYGYLVWDYWMDFDGQLHRGQVRFMYQRDTSDPTLPPKTDEEEAVNAGLMDLDNPQQVQVQRPKKGLGR